MIKLIISKLGIQIIKNILITSWNISCYTMNPLTSLFIFPIVTVFVTFIYILGQSYKVNKLAHVEIFKPLPEKLNNALINLVYNNYL